MVNILQRNKQNFWDQGWLADWLLAEGMRFSYLEREIRNCQHFMVWRIDLILCMCA
jgi:hypothetical protein